MASSPTPSSPLVESSGGNAVPVNIPLPPSRFNSRIASNQPALESNVRQLVGSPENISSLPSQSITEYFTPDTSGTSPSPEAGNQEAATSSAPGLSRPGFRRSATSASTNPRHRQRHSSISTATDVKNSLLRFSQRERQPNHGHEWTVFGELMGQSRTEEDREASYSSPLPRPAARDSLLDVLSPNLSSTLRVSPRGTVPPSPAHATMSQSTPDTRRSRSPDSLQTISSLSEETESLADGSSSPPVREVQFSRFSYLIPTLTPVQRNILKCAIAYFIGSLFTFSPYLSAFIADLTGNGPGEAAPSPSGHMVATVAVYFNPAKTVGGMLDADTFCLMGVLYATIVSLGSMSMYWFFEVKPGLEWLADTFVIVWIGLGMSLMAWMKQWMGKPTFNTACSMTSIILFVVVVKEGGLTTLLQVSFIILVGSLISNLICFTLWPQRATRNLQSTMTQTLDSFATLLTMITQTFLLEEPLLLVSQEKLDKATKDHQGSFTKLKKDLTEAQSERLVGGPGKPEATLSAATLGLAHESPRTHLGQAYEDAVDSLNRLGQHLNGLRSGISVQFELVKASRDGRLRLRKHAKGARTRGSSTASALNGNGKGKVVDLSAEDSVIDGEDDTALLQVAADAFGDVIEDLGPPLKALSSACTSSLKRLRETFNDPRAEQKGVQELKPEEFHDLADHLERALFTFESTSNHAVLRLYRKGAGTSTLEESVDSLRASRASIDENSVLMGGDSESIFLVYFFFFTLQEFAKELISLVDAMSRICNVQRETGWRRLLRPWNYVRNRIRRLRTSSSEKRKSGLKRRFSAYFLAEPAHKSVSFPKITPHAPNTKQTPAREDLSFIDRVGRTIWAIGARLKENDLRYAIKAGMATAMLAAPAFFDATRPIFVEYRGEWALISFFVVISPTIGATNFLGIHRVLGTLFGAATAVAIWTAFPENPYVLSIFGFFFSIPCFYYIVAQPQYATSARFVLLTYNLTCLYSYNLRQKDISIVDIAFHRATAVTVGVVWAWIVSRWWWPIEARRELGKALGEFCLNIGWLYTRLVAFNSWENSGPPIGRLEASEPSEMTALLSGSSHLTESVAEFMAMELHLQIKLIELQGLLAQTQHEPRLKGPFPVKLYRSMLTSLQTILDKLHSMRCVTSREEWHTTVRRDFIIPTNIPRRDMVGNVILYFSTLAAAFRLKSPLPPYLPPAETARQRLVDAIRKLDVVKNREVRGSRQLLFFAYAITMRGVIQELDYLGRTLQETFGVIGDSTEAFEALFQETAHEIA